MKLKVTLLISMLFTVSLLHAGPGTDGNKSESNGIQVVRISTFTGAVNVNANVSIGSVTVSAGYMGTNITVAVSSGNLTVNTTYAMPVSASSGTVAILGNVNTNATIQNPVSTQAVVGIYSNSVIISSVNVSSTTPTLLDSTANRMSIVIQYLDYGNLYVGYNSNVSTNTGIQIPSGATLTDSLYNGSWYAITDDTNTLIFGIRKMAVIRQ